ncbi:MAG TPA: response regulator [Verrucomicrobiae bacterium]|nr:response regulator [Verrucomicrobiae bacterium]
MSEGRILIVDDSEIVLEMARGALEGAGFEVLTAMNAMEANEFIFADRRPDLIILDVMLPMLDGDRKAKMLKEDELTRHIPILLISSKPDDDLRVRVKESRCNGYIRKPFTDAVIVEKVRGALAEPRR